MAVAAILALFPLLYLFAPRLAFVALAVGILMLVHRRALRRQPAGRQPDRFRRESEHARQAAWKDPWGTDGLGL
jgi:hypothetical protein